MSQKSLSMALPGADWMRLRRRRVGRHKRILAAERAFHAALLEVGPADICVDCGANVGLYTAFMARTGAQVHAFEPDPLAFRHLSERMGRAANVVLHQKAVGTVAGTMPLYRAAGEGPAHTVTSSLINESPKLGGGKAVAVEVVDFPRFLDGLPKAPRILKLDIEGAEVAILGALFASRRIERIGNVFVETHEKQLPSLRARTFALIDEARRQGWGQVNFDWG